MTKPHATEPNEEEMGEYYLAVREWYGDFAVAEAIALLDTESSLLQSSVRVENITA